MLLLGVGVSGGCQRTQPVKDPETALRLKQYAVAIPMLQKNYTKAESRVAKGKLAYQLGDAYRATGKLGEAIPWFKTAYDNQFGTQALEAYAYALKHNEQYTDAAQAFKDLGIEIGSPYEYRREIMACQIADTWRKSDRKEYVVEELSLNTKSSEYAPFLTAKGELVFTSDRSQNTKKEPMYGWTNRAFSDIYIAGSPNDGSATLLPGSVNTSGNEGALCYSRDEKQAFFTRCQPATPFSDAFCKLMWMEKNGDGQWSTPQELPFQKQGVNYMHPAISSDSKTLYYAANDPEGWGGYDLYEVKKQADGSWGEPRPLSRSINTIGNEKFPVLHADTLYFSSDYLPGMGGLDIFRVYKLNPLSWSEPQNMKAPINSGADDFGLTPDPTQNPKPKNALETGYFATNRNGNDDLYRYSRRELPPLPPTPKQEIVYKITLQVFVLEKIFQEPGNPNSRVLGRKPLPGSTLSYILNGEETRTTLNEDGTLTLDVTENTDYAFTASKTGYLNNRGLFSTKGVGKDPNNPVRNFELEIVLDKIYINQEIRLENIYYDFDKWDIRDDAKPTLNALASLLQLNPNINIQLSSHTDCRGKDQYNESLSQRRAQAAVDYLGSLGISTDRLFAKGYGESLPVASCECTQCTEDEHQFNRRTAFTILE